jgi:hypothetical protein
MNCAVHAEAEARGYCRNCGKAMCAGCTREVRGVLYCEDCLAATVSGAAPAAAVAAAPDAGNPATAAVLGLFPGLGAVYNGEYVKALVHLLVFGGIITMLDRTNQEGIFVPMLLAFLVYQPVEAYKTARAKMLCLPLPNPLSNIGKDQPIGAYALIGFGILMLLARQEWLWERIAEFGIPLAFIGFGVFLLNRQLKK